MKKITLMLIMAGITIASASFKFLSKNKSIHSINKRSGKPVDLLTLNGIPYLQARKMVQDFTDDPTINDNETSVYFSAKVFHSMDSVLNTDGLDGLRIYFGKINNGAAYQRNTAVVVSTFFGGTVARDITDTIHEDYFQQSEPYMYPTNAQNVNGVPHYDNDQGGARLFSNNPGCAINTCPATNHYVTCKKAKNMVNAFLNDNPQNTINSSNEWFDKAVINSLDNILQQSPGNSGLRIYFAKHDQIDDVPDQDGVYLHCFLLITTLSQNGVNTDNFTCIPVVNKTTIYRKYRVLGGGGGGGGTDNGEQCPNNCDGVTLP